METGDIYCYEWDRKLQLGDDMFGKKLHKSNYNDDAASTIAFPSDYILAKFSDQAYKDIYLLPDGWELLTTARNPNITNGYNGVAFWNSKLCQVVVAHRGTKLSNPGALISDLLLAFNKEKTGQSQSAATFVHLVCEQIKTKNSEGGPRFHLSITGHSLGAWLAQVTTFTAKYLKVKSEKFVEDEDYVTNIHPHTVVFESPGCKEALVKLAQTFVPRYVNRKYGNYDTLDMTVYLSKLNPINSINKHVGTIYMIQSKTHSIIEIVGLFRPDEKHEIEKEIVLDFQSGMYASSKLLIQKLLPFTSTEKYILKKPVTEDKYSLNVFTEDELEFVKDWDHAVTLDSPTVQQFRLTNSVPIFEVNYEYNTIQGVNLNEAVSCVKRLRPTKTTIFELLKSDADVKAYSVIFKLEAQHFQKSLLQFHNYYFKDNYRLKEFLKSKECHVLNIRVDTKSTLEYELETSILNSVFTFYQTNEKSDAILVENYFKQERYCFINWNKLNKVRNFLPTILSTGKDKVNLLVVECFETDERDQETILQFLRENSVKVILMSTNNLFWAKENNIMEVAGFGSNITFQDLIEDSQKEFMSHQHLILHEKKLSLNDIVDAGFPFNNEVYERLNKAIPVRALLEFMLTPITQPVVMNCPYNNLLQAVVFLDLYREIDLTELLTRCSNQSLFIIQDRKDHGLSQNYRNIIKEAGKENIEILYDVNIETICLDNLEKIVYLFTVEKDKLVLTKMFNKNFYVPRNIVQEKIVSSLIFNNLNEDLDQYYFYGNEKKFKEMVSYVDKKQRGRFKFLNFKGKAKEFVQNAKTNAHLLEINDENIVWLYSCGSIECLRKYMHPQGTRVKEIEVTNNKEVVIISGEPGMGKSSSIGHLFYQLQKSYWVFAIPLKHAVFDDLCGNINFDSAAKFILKSCGKSDVNCIQHLLSYCLKNSRNFIYLMFDAFDEIHEGDARQKFISLINFLKNSPAKILITTRKYRSKELENGISVFASGYEAFDYETEVLNFFKQFFYSQLCLFEGNIDVTEIDRFVPDILQSAQDIFGDTISKFIGIPIQMRMLAEVITPQDSSASQQTVVDILGLYQKYAEIHYNIYFKRSGFFDSQTVKEWLSECISGKLYKLAAIKMFNLDKNIIAQKDIEELNKVGLIQSDPYNDFDCEFLHDSVRDYFIAYLLKLWLESSFELFHNGWDVEQFIVSDFLLKGEFKEVRFFLNCYLKNVLISSSRLHICQNKFQQLWGTNQVLFCNNHESIFHICVKENLCLLMQHFLFQIINNADKTALFSKRNFDLETPLFLAISMVDGLNNNQNVLSLFLEEVNELQSSDDIKTVFIATLFTYFITSEHIDILEKYSKNYIKMQKVIKEIKDQYRHIETFLEASKSDDLKKINNILKQLQNDQITRGYLLLTTNERRETCLHLTTSKEILEVLLKFGASKDLQDHHGMTPLTRAIKRGSTDIATILIKDGASLIADYVGNSPLIHAAKYDNLEVVRLLLTSKNVAINIDVDKRNVFEVTPLMMAAKNGNELIVKYLLDKGADVSAADWNGMTPVYHAVKGGHTNLIKTFRQKDADLNIQDHNGITPLLYSITKRRWNMVTSLVDNGADINIRSSRNIYPLKLLIEMDMQQIIKRVLEKDEKKAKDGTIIFSREAARTDCLTEEEKVYIQNLQSTSKRKMK